MAAKDGLFGVGLFLGILAVILLVIFFFWYILFGLMFLVCLFFLVIIVIIAIVAVIFIFAVPYYAIKKKPEVQYGGGYKLEDVKGKEDEEKTKK